MNVSTASVQGFTAGSGMEGGGGHWAASAAACGFSVSPCWVPSVSGKKVITFDFQVLWATELGVVGKLVLGCHFFGWESLFEVRN